jgi:hypothetical protein
MTTGELFGYSNDGADEDNLFLATTGDPLVLVSNCVRVNVCGGNKIDGQTSGGTNKGRVKFKGLKLSKINVSFIVLPDEEDYFWENVFVFFRMPGDKGRALPLEAKNATINRAGVPTVTIEDYKVGEADPVRGREIFLELREWSDEVFDPKPDPNQGKNRKQPPGPLDPEQTTLGDTPRPRA